VPSCALRAHHILYTMPANRSGSVFTITTGSLLLIGSSLSFDGRHGKRIKARDLLSPQLQTGLRDLEAYNARLLKRDGDSRRKSRHDITREKHSTGRASRPS
jgi:hypothetical protein